MFVQIFDKLGVCVPPSVPKDCWCDLINTDFFSNDCGFPNAFTTICLSSKECKCLCLIENSKLIAGGNDKFAKGNNDLLVEMINELKVILEVMKMCLRKL